MDINCIDQYPSETVPRVPKRMRCSSNCIFASPCLVENSNLCLSHLGGSIVGLFNRHPLALTALPRLAFLQRFFALVGLRRPVPACSLTSYDPHISRTHPSLADQAGREGEFC
jgi:hypothetical protein